MTRPRSSEMVWAALAVIVVLATAASASRVIAGTRRSPASSQAQTIVNAQSVAEEGILIGDSSALVRIVVFSDFECPYCRRMHVTLRKLGETSPREVAILYRHFPISRLGFAFPAAIAAECAAEQGKSESFVDSLFASQDTLGRVNLQLLALQSGLLDTARFRFCRSGRPALQRIRDDIKVGRQLGIRATPALIVGDHLTIGELAPDALSALVKRVHSERGQGGWRE